MSVPLEAPQDVGTFRFTLNGREVSAATDETILEAASRHGIEIPHLCYTPGMRPDGNCRACVVEIKGERVLAPSCCRAPAAGMDVHEREQPRTPRAEGRRRDAGCPTCRSASTSPTRSWSSGGAGSASASRASRRARSPRADVSHPAMAVNLDACIQCTRCVRACREEQVNDVIGYAFRGAHSKIVFDLDDPMGASTCVACGECVQACPDRRAGAGARRIRRRDGPDGRLPCVRTAASAASSPTT